MNPVMLWIGSVVIGGTVVALTVPAALRARSEASVQAGRLAQVRVLVQRVTEREAHATFKPEKDDSRASLPERLSDAVAAAGLPKGVLVSVSPGQQEAIDAPEPMLRQHASVSVGNLTLPELGRLLERWRAAEPAWVVAGIDVAPESKNKAEPGADLPLRANLSLERLAAGEAP